MNGFESLCSAILFWSEEALGLAIYAGALAGLLAVVVLAVNIFCRRWLSARQMGLLWGLVLLRLLLPVAPSSLLSLQNLSLPEFGDQAEPRDFNPLPAIDRGAAIPMYGSVGYSQPVASTAAGPYSAAPPAIAAAAPAIEQWSIEDWIPTILISLWLCGATVTLLGATIVYWAFCRRLKQVVACQDPRLGALWNACREQAGVRREIPIVLTDRIEQPAVLGLVRPKLLLPEDAAEFDDRQLRMIMLHELAHVRRWHIAANWALLVIRAIHWWNPIYWLAAARFQNLREQSCDAFAIQRMERESSREYGELLLTLIRRQHSRPAWRVMLPASILGFVSSFFRKRAVRNRLKALPTAGVVRSRWHAIAVAAIVALAAASGLTDARTPEPTLDRSFDWLPHAGHDWSHSTRAPEIDRAPNVTRDYDVEEALKRIVEDGRSEEIARLELRSLAAQTVAVIEGGYDGLVNDPQWAKDRVELDGEKLIVKASLKAHAEIARNLTAWEQSGLGQISVETRFISGPADITSALGISWRYLEAFSDEDDEQPLMEHGQGGPAVRAKAAVEDYLPITVASLNERQAHAIAQAAQEDRSSNILQAPKVTLFNGQRAIILDRTQTPFAVGVQADSAGVQRAKVAVIDEGIKLMLRTIQSRDAAKVELEARIELSQIKEVATASTVLNGSPTTIQIPRVKRCRIDISSAVPDGRSLLIGCIPAYEQKKFFYILLTPRIVELPADEVN